MKRCLIALVTIALVLSSCSGASVSPKEMIDALCLAADLPTGTVYFSNSGDGYALTPQLLAVSYGIPLDFDGIEGAAVRFSSFKHPCEIAVFLCKNTRAVEDVILFCNERISTLIENATSSASLCGMSREDYIAYVSGGIVVLSGRYVALIIAPDARELRRIFIRMT